jgi:hypothetical protein
MPWKRLCTRTIGGQRTEVYVQYLNPVLSRKGKPHCYVDPSDKLIGNKYQKRRKFRLVPLVYSACHRLL